MKKMLGFSLLELVIVLAIISVISVVGVSEYSALQGKARAAKVLNISGAVRMSANLARAVCMMDISGVQGYGTCTPTGGTADMAGGAVAMINQYPAARLDGIIRATQIEPDKDGVVIVEGNPLFIDVEGGKAPSCRVSYTEALPGKIPLVNVDVTGC